MKPLNLHRNERKMTRTLVKQRREGRFFCLTFVGQPFCGTNVRHFVMRRFVYEILCPVLDKRYENYFFCDVDDSLLQR